MARTSSQSGQIKEKNSTGMYIFLTMLMQENKSKNVWHKEHNNKPFKESKAPDIHQP